MYLTHKNPNDYWIIDVESDLIPATIVWCIVLQNVGTHEIVIFRPDDLCNFRSWVHDHRGCIFVGHNAISFDVPVLNRLLGAGISLDDVVDTLVLSYLYDPRMPGPEGAKTRPHSLMAWGIRLRLSKGEYNDFSHFNEDMLQYCIQDVAITLVLFNRLTERMRKRGFSERSCKLEHSIRAVLDGQEDVGFFFDKTAAIRLAGHLRREQERLSGPVQELFPPVMVRKGSYTFRLKQDGTPVASYLRHNTQYPKIEWDDDGNTYHVLDYQTFNIGSPAQRVEKLLSLGWVPQKFTDKGNPQVDEESLLAFFEETKRPEVKAIADWLVLQGRATMVEGWINNCGPDSRIHGRVMTCGAGTRRMTHNSPNTANIPKAKEKVPYGIQCRQLWSVADKDKRRLVGYDASGLEMRCFAHYLNNSEASRIYIEGDPHQVNADMLGIDRDPVKNVFYAFL